MPTVDLALSLQATHDVAREHSAESGDAWDRLASSCIALRQAITGQNRSGGEPSRHVERAALDDATAEALRVELLTLSHDRSVERATALHERVADLVERLR